MLSNVEPVFMLVVYDAQFMSSTHTVASVLLADYLPVRNSLLADPVVDHHPSLDCHPGIVDEALDCPARRSGSYFVHQVDL